MPGVVAKVHLPFYMRLPKDLRISFILEKSIHGKLTATERQAHEEIQLGVIRTKGGRIAETLMWLPSATQSSIHWPTTTICLRFEDVPHEWTERLPRNGTQLVLPGPKPPRIVLEVAGIVNRLIECYLWVSGEQWNGGLISPLTLADVLNCLSIQREGSEEVFAQYVRGWDNTPLPPPQAKSLAQLVLDADFPQGWQLLIRAAQIACAREEVGPALVLGDTAAEVFIDRECLRVLPKDYQVRGDGAYYKDTRIPQMPRKYVTPVRDAAGQSLDEHAQELYHALIYLHQARNNFAHSGEAWYDSPGGRVQVHVAEAQRLVDAAQRAIETTGRLLP